MFGRGESREDDDLLVCRVRDSRTVKFVTCSSWNRDSCLIEVNLEKTTTYWYVEFVTHSWVEFVTRSYMRVRDSFVCRNVSVSSAVARRTW